MATRKITVLDPTSKPRVEEISLAPRIHDLNNKVIGFLWNSKPNGDVLLLWIKEQLSRRFGLSGTNWHQQMSSQVFPESAIEEVASASDMVIVAVAD